MKEIVLIDGGLECELAKVGYDFKTNTQLWTGSSLIDGSDKLKKVHKNFLVNGAQIITTASYQLNIDFLRDELKCSSDEAREILKNSVRIAREAVQETDLTPKRRVAGSIGSYGAYLNDFSEYSGEYANQMTTDFLVEWHRPRFECIVDEKCDLIAFETIPSIKEASALVKLLAEHPSVKAWLSFSCKDDKHISNGDTFKEAYDTFKSNPQLVAIGVNCTSVQFISGLLSSVPLNERTTPFIVYPNYLSENNNIIGPIILNDETFQTILTKLTEWIDLDALYIGGCCNFNADHIKQFQNLISKYNSSI